MTTMTTARPPLLVQPPASPAVATAAATATMTAGAPAGAVTNAILLDVAGDGGLPVLIARAAPTTVPVFVPGYGPDEWSLLRGSIIGSNTNPAETTVTIFCNDQSLADSCELADALPFVFAEGPSTLHYTGELPGTLTVNLACQLDGTTAATCTGYSSYGSGYRPDRSSGSSETSWSSTFSGSAVEWGVLTLSVPPSTTSDDIDVTAGDGSGATAPTPQDSGAASTDSGLINTSGLLYTTATATSAGSSVSIPFGNMFSQNDRKTTGRHTRPSVSVSVSWALVLAACLATAL